MAGILAANLPPRMPTYAEGMASGKAIGLLILGGREIDLTSIDVADASLLHNT